MIKYSEITTKCHLGLPTMFINSESKREFNKDKVDKNKEHSKIGSTKQ